jgi:L-asparaginase
VRKIALITTGGAIEKIFNELTGELTNRFSIVQRMLSELRLEETEIRVIELMSKDSLDMTAADRSYILETVQGLDACTDATTGVVVLHGTDTLVLTGQYLHENLHENLDNLRVPIVLTGAMRPFEMKQSDALQNLTEAIFAAGVLAPGVYCTAHGRVLPFPAIRNDHERGTFMKA